MDLDSAPEPGVELIRGPRRPVEIAPGYLFPIGFAVAAVVAIVVAVSAPAMSVRIVAAPVIFLVGVLFVFAAMTPITVRRYRLGRDGGAGCPLAELGPTGARLRYEMPTPRERRTGEWGRPRYDAAVAWADVTGWRRGIDPFGAPVLVLTVADWARVRVQRRSTALVRVYLDLLREGLRTRAVIRIPGPAAERAAIAFLTARGVPESDARAAPDGWPITGDSLVRRGVALNSGGHAWPARSLGEIFGSLNPDRRRDTN
jgi:hypothetical protein